MLALHRNEHNVVMLFARWRHRTVHTAQISNVRFPYLRNVRNARVMRKILCNATRELNPCANFTQATQGLTNHMASFHLIVTSRAQIGLSPLPVQPRWAIQSNLAGLEVFKLFYRIVSWWNDSWSCSYIEQTEPPLSSRERMKKYLLSKVYAFRFRRRHFFSQKNKQKSNFECLHFYARQHICYSAYMLSPVRPFVCHTGVS